MADEAPRLSCRTEVVALVPGSSAQFGVWFRLFERFPEEDAYERF